MKKDPGCQEDSGDLRTGEPQAPTAAVDRLLCDLCNPTQKKIRIAERD